MLSERSAEACAVMVWDLFCRKGLGGGCLVLCAWGLGSSSWWEVARTRELLLRWVEMRSVCPASAWSDRCGRRGWRGWELGEQPRIRVPLLPLLRKGGGNSLGKMRKLRESKSLPREGYGLRDKVPTALRVAMLDYRGVCWL